MEHIDIQDSAAIIKCLRVQAESDYIRLTIHAHQEMVEENITLADVIRVLERAALVENYPEHKRGPCCLVYGKAESERDVHCTTSREIAIIITVYEPKPPKWLTPFKRGNRK